MEGKGSRSKETAWVKVNFVLDRADADRLREVAFHLRENQSSVLRRVLKEFFNSPAVRKIPRRSTKRD